MELKQEIIDAGLYLQDKELIARTWGNISARIDNDAFYITPSGKAYTDIKDEDIPSVKIKDCSYDKNGPKPSSEKGVHAAAYRLRDNCRYVVHTHQFYASAICAEGFSVKLSDGTFVPCAEYALPGTKKLVESVAKEIKNNPNCDIFLMARHGVIILGETMEEAMNKANYLEEECKKIFEHRVKEFTIPEKLVPYLDDFAQMYEKDGNVDDKEALKMVTEKNAAAMAYARDGKPMGKFDAMLQHFIYKTKYSKLRNKK